MFYLREYPKVVGLLYGLLVSRLVAEELAQETFLVADRDWGRISGLDNPRAWVRRVAINQRGSFLRAYLRQQTRERDAVVRDEEDSIKLADEHAEVWQAVRTLPPLQAQVIALHYYEDYSVAQADAAAGLREILRRTGQLVAHGRTTTLPDRPQEPPEPIPPSPLRQAPPRRTPQRLALVVNLLVLALGIVIGVAATYTQDANGSASPAAAPPPHRPERSWPPGPRFRTHASRPPSWPTRSSPGLKRDDRDNRLAVMLRDYTIASQSCRRAAWP